ncbi:MAG: hypothetical protein ABI134_10630 [Byssovorax sp.]
MLTTIAARGVRALHVLLPDELIREPSCRGSARNVRNRLGTTRRARWVGIEQEGKNTMTMFSRISAVALRAVLGVLLAPGCEIRIGPGTSGSETTEPAGTTTSAGTGPSTTPEEQAAIDALENVDPTEAALKNAVASYSAATTSSLVESQVFDPSTVDAATVQQLFDQYASAGNAAAFAWMEAADATALADVKPYPLYECTDAPNNCKAAEICPLSDGAVCTVTGCGKGKCAWCDAFGGLLYDGYCTYACMQGTKYWGYGFNLRTRFTKGWNGFVCFPFPK